MRKSGLSKYKYSRIQLTEGDILSIDIATGKPKRISYYYAKIKAEAVKLLHKAEYDTLTPLQLHFQSGWICGLKSIWKTAWNSLHIQAAMAISTIIFQW